MVKQKANVKNYYFEQIITRNCEIRKFTNFASIGISFHNVSASGYSFKNNVEKLKCNEMENLA